jgi:hypothetical protein
VGVYVLSICRRLGLFVIIVLGEALAQVVVANTDVAWTAPVIAASLAAFLLLVALWRLTTLYGFTPAARRTEPLEPWQALPTAECGGRGAGRRTRVPGPGVVARRPGVGGSGLVRVVQPTCENLAPMPAHRKRCAII